MKIVPGLAAAVLSVAVSASAQTGEAPCAAVRSATATPCDAPAAAPAPTVLARVDGTPLGVADLDAAFRARIAGVDAAVAVARRRALDAEIADTRLHLEAERRGVSFRDFWESEVLRKTPRATGEDLKPLYEQWKAGFPGKSLDDLRSRLEGVILAANRQRREAEVADALKERFPVTAGADPNAPGLAADTVLATVGPRRITAASAATRLDAAGFGVRRDLLYDTHDVLEALAHARLLRAEAERRGVSAESLEKANVSVDEGHTFRFLGDLPAAPILSLDLDGAPSRGPERAPVTVVEYADFECPHCAKTWRAVEEALERYGDRVRYVYRNFPLPFHEHALEAAEAARAAQAQGRFFELADLLFRNQKSLDAASLKKFAAEAGCDAARFAADLDGGRYAADVLLEARGGERVGVAGTPMLYVNGVWLRWESVDVSGIRAAVDAALGGSARPVMKAARP